MIYNNTNLVLEEDNTKNIKDLAEISDDINVLLTTYNEDNLKSLKKISKLHKCPIIICTDSYQKNEHYLCVKYNLNYIVVENTEDLNIVLTNMKLYETFEVFKIDYKKKEVTYDNVIVKLTSKEIDILKYLYKNKNQVTDRKSILVDVLHYHPDGDTRIVDVYVKYLRTKLGEHGSKIKTVRGVGYKFEI